MKISEIQEWVEHRTGLIGAGARFLSEAIPSSVGWRNTLGSVAGALLAIQIVSGALLMIFYVAHPDAAYQSVKYVEDSLTAGSLVRALHYWGASFIVVALFLHLMRVFYAGAYKKPRELTWVVGVGLFLTVFALSFTGQLLPWDQRGYWAAKVGVEIGSSAPVLGPLVKSLLLGGDSLGALTLTRFYALHVFFLPALLVALIVLHLYLLRRHGPAERGESVEDGDRVSFFPSQMARDAVVITATLIGLILVALILKGPIALPADPTDTSYIPRPEWYFLSHFEILRYTPGSMKLLTTFVLPNLLLVLLVALPWLDRSTGSSFRSRRLIVGGGTIAFASIVLLTLIGIVAHSEPKTLSTTGDSYDMVEAGRTLFAEHNCQSCHRIDGEGQDVGPDLSGVGLRLKADYMKQWLANPVAFLPDTEMPPVQATRQELEELTAYLQSLTQPAEQ